MFRLKGLQPSTYCFQIAWLLPVSFKPNRTHSFQFIRLIVPNFINSINYLRNLSFLWRGTIDSSSQNVDCCICVCINHQTTRIVVMLTFSVCLDHCTTFRASLARVRWIYFDESETFTFTKWLQLANDLPVRPILKFVVHWPVEAWIHSLPLSELQLRVFQIKKQRGWA